jgi:hypothetical protein
MVLEAGNRSAPRVMAGLAGAVHDRQGAAGHKHHGGEDNQQRGFHRDLATAGPRTPFNGRLNRSSDERAVNELCTEVQVRLLLRTMEIVLRTLGFDGRLLLHSPLGGTCARLGAASRSPLGGLRWMKLQHCGFCGGQSAAS